MSPMKKLALVLMIAGIPSARAAEPKRSVGEPAWLAGKPLDEWFAIGGTGGAGGAPVNDFSGMTVKESSSEVLIAAAGGHGGSRDNRVVSIDLRADAPAWILRHAGSPTAPDNVAYNPDGQPASRHTYQSTLYVASLDRVMLFGCRFTAPGAWEFPTVDGFHLGSNTWDPAGTYPDVPAGGGYGVVKNSLTEDVWTSGLKKWSAAAGTWSSPITTTAPAGVRFPYAFDSNRSQLFGLNFGDGQGYGTPVVSAVRVPVSGSQSIQVTFNASAALSQFNSDAPTYSGMDYDPDHDRFLFYCGQGSGAGRIYVITPNSGNVWDMSLYTFGPGSSPPPATGGAGMNNRFRYLPNLKGFVLLSNGADNLYFIRTSPGGGPPVLTSIQVSPGAALVALNETQTFTAVGFDQWGNPLSSQPAFAWSVSGGGTVSPAGLFTAGASPGGPFSVTASSGGLSGTAALTVEAAAMAPGSGSSGGGFKCGSTGLDLLLPLGLFWAGRRSLRAKGRRRRSPFPREAGAILEWKRGSSRM
jgi:hypothetical protein